DAVCALERKFCGNAGNGGIARRRLVAVFGGGDVCVWTFAAGDRVGDRNWLVAAGNAAGFGAERESAGFGGAVADAVGGGGGGSRGGAVGFATGCGSRAVGKNGGRKAGGRKNGSGEAGGGGKRFPI